MKNFRKILFLFLVLSMSILACKKDDHDHDHGASDVILEFDHLWSTNEFSMEKDLLHPRLQETLNFTTMKYYISNVKLRKTDGTWYDAPESYFIIDAAGVNKSNEAIVSNVPAGEYNAVEIMLGVDSTRNVSGSQTGALDPNNGMFWSWNSGYIMIKAEGSSPEAANNSFSFHLGGFKGEHSVPMTRVYEFNNKLIVKEGRKPVVHFYTNVARLWHDGEKLSVRSKQHMPGELAKRMAHGFYEGIKFDHIHN